MLIGGSCCFAQDKVQGCIVELSTGEKLEYRLADNPKFTFDGTTITLTADGVKLEYSPSEFKKVTTGEVANINSGIEAVVSQEGEIYASSGFVRLNGFKTGEKVTIYSINGILMDSFTISTNGLLEIPISILPSGISIIKVNKQSIKITRK